MSEHMKHQHPEFVADTGAKVVADQASRCSVGSDHGASSDRQAVAIGQLSCWL